MATEAELDLIDARARIAQLEAAVWELREALKIARDYVTTVDMEQVNDALDSTSQLVPEEPHEPA